MTDSEQKELGDVFAQMLLMIYEDHRRLFQRNADERGVSLHQFAAAALAQAAREKLDGHLLGAGAACCAAMMGGK